MNIGKINKLSIVNTAYVSGLETIPSPPLELFCIGALPATRQPSVAIIGSRKPTPYGKELTLRFATSLARHNVIIVSGLALGVDGIAHQAALDADGITIAVLANGLHRVYPAMHTQLARQIVRQGGALLSEKEAGYEARPYDFLARNRLVSGLADAILIPEATERSGTTHTVQHALEQGRDVFAIPGPITSPLSAGTNKLIQQGAQVALRPEDILERIHPKALAKRKQPQLPLGDTPLETTILMLIQKGVVEGALLAKQSKAPIDEFLQTMTLLELKGSIRALGADRWTITQHWQ